MGLSCGSVASFGGFENFERENFVDDHFVVFECFVDFYFVDFQCYDFRPDYFYSHSSSKWPLVNVGRMSGNYWP